MTDQMGPIFVCGPSRSGTALVRSILNGHPDVHLAGETHYFDDLRPRLGEHARSGLTEDEKQACEDYFLAIGHRPYGHKGDPERSRHTRAALRAKVAEIGGELPGGDAYFEAFCRLEAALEGAYVWGEKTPRHVFRIGDILTAFPTAKIITLVRDARAVLASYRDWKNQGGFDFEADPGHERALAEDHERARRSYHPIIISMVWKGAIGAAYSAFDGYGPDRVRVQRYEDLVVNPGECIRELAAWAGLEYVEEMQQVPMHNSSYAKFEKKRGVSAAPKDRWRETLKKSEIAVADQVCGKLLERAGYDVIRPSGALPRVALYWLTLPWAVARAAAVNRKRIPNLPVYIWRRLHPRAATGVTLKST